MPQTPRRRLTRRPPPRPTVPGPLTPVGDAVLSARQNAEARRVTENVARQAPYLVAELKRVAGVSAVCLGLLALLAVIDRVR